MNHNYWIRRFLLCAFLVAGMVVPFSAQISFPAFLTASFTVWDMPTLAGTNPTGLTVDTKGSFGSASPAGTVWYGTRTTLVRLVPGSPLTTAAATWTSWSLGNALDTTGLKITADDAVFIRTKNSIQRLNPSTNVRTIWSDGTSLSDLALDAANNVWTTVNSDSLQRLTPAGSSGATLTRWQVGGGVGGITLSGVLVNPSNGLVYYAEVWSNSIAELDPATNRVRRWNLSWFGGQELRQIALHNGFIAATTGLDQIVWLNPTTNQFKACAPPSLGSDPIGVVAGNGLLGFTEKGAHRIGCVAPNNNGGMPIAPSVSVVLPTTTNLGGTSIHESPVSGTAMPINSSEMATRFSTECGTWVEAWLPSGCCAPHGIDIDPTGSQRTYYYATYHGGPTSNRIGRVVLPN